MVAVKKIELVIDSLETKRVAEILDRLGVSGYTIINNVVGKGERGIRSADELTDVFSNSYMIIACKEDEVQKVVDELRPLLKRFGGVGLVSDAQWMVH